MTRETAYDDTALIKVFATAGVITVLLLIVILFVFFGSTSDSTEPVTAEPTSIEEITAAAKELTAPLEPRQPAVVLPRPVWIWSSASPTADQKAYFRKTIEHGESPSRVILRLSCDNEATILVNGDQIGTVDDWTNPGEFDLSPHVTGTTMTIELHARNHGGPAGLIALVEIELDGEPRRRVVSNSTWMAADTSNFQSERAAIEVGRYGVSPWGELIGLLSDDIDRSLQVLEGFVVELVYTVPRQYGSWVSLAVDGQGRLIASAQYQGMYRITPAPSGGDPSETTVEAIDTPVGAAQGLLCIDNDLYCVVAGNYADGSGLYRLRDTNGDDTYDEWRLLRHVSTGGEHGPHGIILGPDGLLYIVAGNHVELPEFERSVVPRRWAEDHLLPRLWDARGHATGILAPGGWIARTDRDGESWELFANGFRNCYDIAFNRDGELFAYDADMEWDMGAPWYRPTRIHHVVSGAEFGWRSGTAKWPTYYPDSLPGILDIGPGSPTGVCFADEAAFPERYQRALYALDWTFGTIYAVHLEPDGASYRAVHEPFVTGRPLPVADIVVSPVDGSMYFVVGGRRVPSAVYRVRYTADRGDDRVASGSSTSDGAVKARALRQQLEAFHHPDASASVIDAIWPHLGNADRFIAYAARVALEHQPIDRWIDRAIAESDVPTKLSTILAAARCAEPSAQPGLIAALQSIDAAQLDREEMLSWLRCWALCFARLGAPDSQTSRDVARVFEAMYPGDDDLVNRELCDLLVYLGSPVVVARTVPLMERMASAPPPAETVLLSRNDTYGSVIQKMASAHPQQQQVHYALSLRNAQRGWTHGLRERYFQWFEAARLTSGGASFAGFLEQIRKDALEQVRESDREYFAKIGMNTLDPPLADVPIPQGPGRQWTVDELLLLASNGLARRDFDNGRKMYMAAQCNECHRFAGTGVMGGPDITAVSTRYTIRDLLESIVEPSRVISDQYEQTEIVLDDGSITLGRVVARDENTVSVITNLLMPEATIEVPVDQIAQERASALSLMMPGLINRLNADEVLDLLAYLLAEGDSRHPMFVQGDAEGFVPLFDGTSLDGWKGDGRFWQVEDGMIVGRTTADAPLARNTFLILTGSAAADFELRAEVRLIGDNNSGIQYRGEEQGGFGVHGYQCDIHPNPPYTGMLYDEGGRGVVATQGQRIRLLSDGRTQEMEDAAPVMDIALDAWHEYTILVRGNRLEHRIDDNVTIIVEDEFATRPPAVGVIALQLHAGAPYEVRFRNIRYRRID